VTVLEIIQRSTEFLARKGIEAPRLQAELLLAHVLKLPRMRLYLSFERVLAEAEVAAMRESVVRRGAREPLQHIVGSTSFCGYEIAVNCSVLVPRPETELLAELGWNFLKEKAAETGGEVLVLDFGTGSGCLAIALAHNCPAARIDALELRPESLALARQNVAAHSLTGRVLCFEGKSLEALPAGRRYHLVISNPPYIPSGEIAGLEPEVRDYEPRDALDGGPDGLDFYRYLAVAAAVRLLPGGRLMVEFGDGQADAVTQLLKEQNWIVEAPMADYTGRLRLLAARLP